MADRKPAPRVSVALPAYNAEATLGQTVESVLAQDFEQFELLLLDDGSTDRTREIAENLATHDRRICLISRENRGLSASLNDLFEMAQAPLIARLDADDICEPLRFSKQVAFLDDNPEYGLVGCQATTIDYSGKEMAHLYAPVPCRHEDIIAALPHYCPFYHPAVMIRRHLALTAGGYRTAYRSAQDYDLWLRLAEVTRMANLPDRLLRYRVHTRQMSSVSAVDQAREAAIAWLSHQERQSGRPDSMKGLSVLPNDDQVDHLFGLDSISYVRRRISEQVTGSPTISQGDP